MRAWYKLGLAGRNRLRTAYPHAQSQLAALPSPFGLGMGSLLFSAPQILHVGAVVSGCVLLEETGQVVVVERLGHSPSEQVRRPVERPLADGGCGIPQSRRPSFAAGAGRLLDGCLNRWIY